MQRDDSIHERLADRLANILTKGRVKLEVRHKPPN